MEIRNSKKKAVDKRKTLPAKRKTSGKDTASGAKAKKKLKSAGKTSAKSLEKEKKSPAGKTSKETVKAKKDLTAVSSQAAKKGSAKKSLKPAQVKLKQKTTKRALTKVPSSSKKISRRTAKNITKKIIKAKTPRTKKAIDRGIKLRPVKKPEMMTKQEMGPEEKNAPPQISEKILGHEYSRALPGEYGENELILIAVDPNMVFVDWEISQKEASRAMDGFTMRVYDVTGQKPQQLPKESFVDVKLKNRVGRAFFELGLPGRKVAIEIGVYKNGKFLPVLSSWAISMPRLLSVDELGIALKLLEAGIPVGY